MSFIISCFTVLIEFQSRATQEEENERKQFKAVLLLPVLSSSLKFL